MNINNKIDMHNHTIASGHAYSTITEMCMAAKQMGIQYYGFTEHAPAMPGTCEEIHFCNYKVIDRQMFGLNLMFGAEVNILDQTGKLDLPDQVLALLDHIIISLHTPTYFGKKTITDCTNAVLSAMQSPYPNILGHPDDSQFPLDYDKVIAEAKKQKIIIEVNNASFSPWSYRKNGRENAKIFLERCVHYEVPVLMNSDAHIFTKTGHVEFAQAILEENHFPEELILNHQPDLYISYINERRKKWGGKSIEFDENHIT